MQIGTGWLGWTERETLQTAIPTIELAFDGLVEKLKAIHGSAPAEEPAKPSAESIFSAFRYAAAEGHK